MLLWLIIDSREDKNGPPQKITNKDNSRDLGLYRKGNMDSERKLERTFTIR